MSQKQSYESGYSVKYALANKYKRPRKHKLPKGWRWLLEGEYRRVGDVCCDDRIPPVTLICGDGVQTKTHHPTRTKKPRTSGDSTEGK